MCLRVGHELYPFLTTIFARKSPRIYFAKNDPLFKRRKTLETNLLWLLWWNVDRWINFVLAFLNLQSRTIALVFDSDMNVTWQRNAEFKRRSYMLFSSDPNTIILEALISWNIDFTCNIFETCRNNSFHIWNNSYSSQINNFIDLTNRNWRWNSFF